MSEPGGSVNFWGAEASRRLSGLPFPPWHSRPMPALFGHRYMTVPTALRLPWTYVGLPHPSAGQPPGPPSSPFIWARCSPPTHQGFAFPRRPDGARIGRFLCARVREEITSSTPCMEKERPVQKESSNESFRPAQIAEGGGCSRQEATGSGPRS